MDMRFRIWNVSSPYRASSLKALGSELAKYKLDIMAGQEVKWVECGSQPADDYTFLYETAFSCIVEREQQLSG
jgi:hypothetical protein